MSQSIRELTISFYACHTWRSRLCKSRYMMYTYYMGRPQQSYRDAVLKVYSIQKPTRGALNSQANKEAATRYSSSHSPITLLWRLPLTHSNSLKGRRPKPPANPSSLLHNTASVDHTAGGERQTACWSREPRVSVDVHHANGFPKAISEVEARALGMEGTNKVDEGVSV